MKVEYKVIEFGLVRGPVELEDELNKLGTEGWEMIDHTGTTAIFMRKPGPILVFNTDGKNIPPEAFDDLRDALGDDLARLMRD